MYEFELMDESIVGDSIVTYFKYGTTFTRQVINVRRGTFQTTDFSIDDLFYLDRPPERYVLDLLDIFQDSNN
jgi:hypothetical protein|tara:strand:- start:9494 stop:9709 length:216 start_codon:yes stop_codon:yes gene_type:complete